VILLAGLGPAGLDAADPATAERLLDPELTVVVRTLEHPAAAELAARRAVISCDDIYDGAEDFNEVYAAIADRVVALAAAGPVAYAVPGSPLVGERSAFLIRRAAATAGIDIEMMAGASFLDLVLERAGIDPLERGLQVLDARDLPDPLLLYLPTVIGQIDTPLVLHGARDALLRLLPADTEVLWLADLGGPTEQVARVTLEALGDEHAGLRASLVVDLAEAPGWPGLIETMIRLRRECPWDRRQTHHSLAGNLIEEAYETLSAIESLPAEAPGGEPDHVAYADLEEELGDLLLQVVFHANMAAETGAFDAETVAESLRRKLVFRHPHVFGDVEVAGVEEVLSNWERLKGEEKDRESLLDGVPDALPALARSFAVQRRVERVGFDWPDLQGVVAKVHEELDELLAAGDDAEARAAELGDLLFAVVNLGRHMGVDPEQALRRACGRFERRFRAIEDQGTLAGLNLEEMDERWEAAKAAESDARGSSE
jgi:tetrapyrrole methylase family protein/MazG family protein